MKSDNPIPENPATERSGLLIRDLNADENHAKRQTGSAWMPLPTWNCLHCC